MITQQMRTRAFPAMLALTAACLIAPVHAQSTIAYYRFEQTVSDAANGGGTTITDGQKVAANNNTSANYAVYDSTGHGNNLRAYNPPNAPVYSSKVPASTIPQTGAANSFSLGFAGSQDLYSEGRTGGGANGTTLNDHNFTQFTIESSVLFNTVGDNFQTFIGQDRGGNPGNLFFQKNNTDHISIIVRDSVGNYVSVQSTETVVANQWYNFAATADGSTLNLYQQTTPGGAYALQGTTATPNGGLATDGQTFSIGRGFYFKPTDNVNGNIDEVRFSDAALAPSKFLFSPSASAAPEPSQMSALAIVSLGLGGLLLARRRRACSAE